MRQADVQSPPVCRIEPQDVAFGPTIESMNFLNEAAGRFPDAISFAAGRPPDGFVAATQVGSWLQHYVEHRAIKSKTTLEWLRLGQYSDTAGVIRDLIVKYVECDEDVTVKVDDCIITNGFQEALLVQLIQLARAGGAVLTLDPTYVGLSGAAMAAGIPVFAVPASEDPAKDLAQAARAARAAGHQVLAAYVIADFSNPSGEVMSVDQRRALLAMAEKHDVLLLEDAAYRIFSYDAPRLPSLLSLDTSDRVVYLGSFAKIFLPGVRVGFSVRRAVSGRLRPLVVDPIAVKSFTTVATSPIAQGIVGGFLLEANFKVSEWNTTRIAYCRANRDIMLTALAEAFAGVEGVTWSRPRGGFFVVISLSREFTAENLIEVARDFGVIVTPMSFFSPSGGLSDKIRLSFSNVTPDQIRAGVKRLADYLL